MATDVNLQVINSMTQDKMNALKDANGKIPSLANQLIITDDEDVNLSCLRTEVVYDMSSSDSSINWGHAGGIQGGVIVSGKNFSKYSSLIIKATFGNMLGQYVIDLNKLTVDGSAYDGSLKCTTESVTNTNEFYSISKVTSDKTTFYHIATGYTSGTTLGQMNNNSQYYVYKIEGILKTPAMIYTGAELHEGDGIKIKNGVISGNYGRLLWTNPNPTNGFSAQTLTLDLSKYDLIFISYYTRAYSDRGFYHSIMISKNTKFYMYSFDLDGNRKFRDVTATDTGINFGTPNSSEACMPYQIYGIRIGE